MNRTVRRRRQLRRLAVERANRQAQFVTYTTPSASVDKSILAERETEAAWSEDWNKNRVGLPFEIATEGMEAEENLGVSTMAIQNEELAPGDVTAQAANTDPVGITEEPSAEDLLYNAAREAQGQGEARRAMSIYRELLTVNPDHLRARNNLGLLLDQEGDSEAALRELRLCLNADPSNAQVLVNRGGILGGMGRYKEAEADLKKALEQDDANAEAHFNLGLLMTRRGVWADALPYMRRSIEIDNTQAHAYLYLGDALNHVDDLSGALQAYQRVVELNPSSSKAYYGMGIIFDRLSRPDDAQQMYRKSRELNGR